MVRLAGAPAGLTIVAVPTCNNQEIPIDRPKRLERRERNTMANQKRLVFLTKIPGPLLSEMDFTTETRRGTEKREKKKNAE